MHRTFIDDPLGSWFVKTIETDFVLGWRISQMRDSLDSFVFATRDILSHHVHLAIKMSLFA